MEHHIDKMCHCGVARRAAGQRNCLACHANAMRRWRQGRVQTAEQRAKSNARSYLHTYIKRGKVRKGPCTVCGAAEVEAHHEDYARPLDVIWLCRKHHLAHHRVSHAREFDRERVDSAVRDGLPRSTCPCGAPRRSGGNNCTGCHAAWMRAHRKPPEGEARARANARAYLNVYVRRGKIVRGACAVCGASEVEAHHEDYSRPLVATWLCREHHPARRRALQAAQ